MAKRRKDDMDDTSGSEMPFGGKGKMGGGRGKRKKGRKGKRSKGRY
jgi:hypothetical protein